MCYLLSPCALEGDAEVPTVDVDINIEEKVQEEQKEQQENKNGENQPTQESEGKKVRSTCVSFLHFEICIFYILKYIFRVGEVELATNKTSQISWKNLSPEQFSH